MLNIVVAYYNNTHFENSLAYFGDEVKVTVYDKSNSTYTSSRENTTIKTIENVGREGETYLRHIIENYEMLDDYILFIQDDTDNHIISFQDFYDTTMSNISSNTMFYQYDVQWRPGYGSVKRTIENGYCQLWTFSSPYAIKDVCERFCIRLPNTYIAKTCAFFMAHKSIILARPKSFYIQLKEWLFEHEGNGFALEHMWSLVFDNHSI